MLSKPHVAPHSAPSPFTATQRTSARRRACTFAMSSESAVDTRVTFQNAAKHNLAGILLGDSQQVVILCHGYTDHKNSFHFPAMASALNGEGLSSLRFDFAGNGESEGPFEFGNYSKEVEDIRAAVGYIRASQKEVVGIVGHSKGGNDVLLYAAKYNDIPVVVNIAGRYNMTEGIEQRFGATIFQELSESGGKQFKRRTLSGTYVDWTLTNESMQERLHTDMDAAATAIQSGKIYTVHGSADQVIPVKDAHMFHSLIKNHTLEIVNDADHNFRNPVHGEQLVRVIAKIFADNLSS